MSKITTRSSTQLNDIFSDSVVRCAALVKEVMLPMRQRNSADSLHTHEYSQEYYVVAQIEALNIGPAKQLSCSVEVVIDTDSELESNGIFKSLCKAKEDGVYVIFDAVYLAVHQDRAILQGARAEITNLKCDAYLNMIGSGSVTR
ncbi:hypothetical protein PN836_015055 [Ningiella sp. W23]|uniref:hypothetical protein n=1 Tax=Ningiella sp. W23 TaxID=3023715 RepID=UPI00375845DD